MLQTWLKDPLWLRLAQAGIALLVGLFVLALAQRRQIDLFRDGAGAIIRGLLQIISAGGLLLLLFRGSVWLAPLALCGMIVVAARIAARRAQRLPSAQRVALLSITAAAGLTIGLMAWIGVIAFRTASLLPVGSMLIANAMTTTALAFERLQAELTAHTGQIEAALALGATPHAAIAPQLRAAVRASMLPRIDTMRSLGIVWIPGLMTGMLLANSPPIQAALYQFVVVTLILAVGALSSLCATWLICPLLFTQAEQLKPLTHKQKGNA